MDFFPTTIGALTALFVAILCFHWFFKDWEEFKDCLMTFHPRHILGSHGHPMDEVGKTLQLAGWVLVWLGSGLMAGWFVVQF